MKGVNLNKLIRCTKCDEVILKTPFDQWPEYVPCANGSFESFETSERDDFQDFLRNHRGHRLEDLKILEDSFVSEKDYSEPVKTSYFRATNGKENFVVKKFRDRIDEPLKYQLIYGDYSLSLVDVKIQSKEIIRQLNAEFETNSLRQNKIEAFLELFQSIAKTIDIRKMERIAEESPNASEIFYRMDDISLAYLLRNCRNIFKGQEYANIADFIDRHKDDGVLLLKATYKIQITEMAKPRRVQKTRPQEAAPAYIPMKTRSVAEKG
jgi:hypothetical protein